ncbi:hypothetical protein AAVH_37288, partial [Aphelenchoides avenae]
VDVPEPFPTGFVCTLVVRRSPAQPECWYTTLADNNIGAIRLPLHLLPVLLNRWNNSRPPLANAASGIRQSCS